MIGAMLKKGEQLMLKLKMQLTTWSSERGTANNGQSAHTRMYAESARIPLSFTGEQIHRRNRITIQMNFVRQHSTRRKRFVVDRYTNAQNPFHFVIKNHLFIIWNA